MAEERLEIILEADVKSAIASLKGASDALKDLGVNGAKNLKQLETGLAELRKLRAGATTAADLNQINTAIAGLSAQAAKLKRPLDSAAIGISNVKKSVQGANPALVNFGRVVQDAPFGILGIANNIDPLVESFGRLKKETGSTGGALKALGGALLGPAGIGIAVSAITSALIAFGPQIKAFFAGTKNAAASAAAAAKAVEDLDNAVAEFGTTVNQAAGKELSGLRSIISGIENVNLSQQQRIFYVDELQKKYPAYFGNLTNEQILAGQTGDAYKRLTADILAASKARAAQDVLSKIAAQQLTIEEKKAKAAAAAEKNIKEARTGTRLIAGGSITGAGGGTVTVTAEEKQKFAREQLAITTKALDADLAKLNKQAEFYVKFVDAGAAATANLGAKLPPVTKAIKASSEANKEKVSLLNEELLLVDELIIRETNRGRLASLATAGPANTGAGQAGATKRGIDPAILKIQENFALLQNDAKNTAAVIGNVLSPAVDSVFNALASGENVFKALGDSVKGFVLDLVKAIAKALILKAIFSALNLSTGGGAGIAKGILGTIFGGRAGGGAVTPGGGYIVGENGPEKFYPTQAGAIVPAGGGMGGGELTAKFSANTLLFAVSTAARNQRMNFG